jgi:hypothetical protein
VPRVAEGAGHDRSQYATVRRAAADTERSSLKLLELPYPFTQDDLRTPNEFAKIAARQLSRRDNRRLKLDEHVLEALHRHEVLVPLLRVDPAGTPGADGIDISESLTAQQVHTTVVRELMQAEPRTAGSLTPWQ